MDIGGSILSEQEDNITVRKSVRKTGNAIQEYNFEYIIKSLNVWATKCAINSEISESIWRDTI